METRPGHSRKSCNEKSCNEKSRHGKSISRPSAICARDGSARTISTLVAAIVLVLLGGCAEPSLQLIPVTGVVTLDGDPVQGVALVFQYQGAGPPARGVTDEVGWFQLTTRQSNDGVVAGLHTVTILGFRHPVASRGGDEDADPNQPRDGTWFIPRRYAFGDTSNLEADVSSTNSHFEFQLATEPKG
jgi:hypothetical protein